MQINEKSLIILSLAYMQPEPILRSWVITLAL
jgi:hypothetical protein